METLACHQLWGKREGGKKGGGVVALLGRLVKSLENTQSGGSIEQLIVRGVDQRSGGSLAQ